MKNIFFILFIIALSGCAGTSGTKTQNNPVTAYKPDDMPSAEIRRNLMIGKWLGNAPTKEGGTRKWLVERAPDGTFKITFRRTNPDGSIKESVEVGEWGISGPIYFTITRGWIKNNEFVPADETQPYFYDAYNIISLTEKEFVYQNFVTGNKFTIKKVSDEFEL